MLQVYNVPLQCNSCPFSRIMPRGIKSLKTKSVCFQHSSKLDRIGLMPYSNLVAGRELSMKGRKQIGFCALQSKNYNLLLQKKSASVQGNNLL